MFMPFSRFLLDDDLFDETVVDVVDSPLFVVFLVRVIDDVDKDETFVLRGMLSIDDCEDAMKGKKFLSSMINLKGFFNKNYFVGVLDDNDGGYLQSSWKLERPSTS